MTFWPVHHSRISASKWSVLLLLLLLLLLFLGSSCGEKREEVPWRCKYLQSLNLPHTVTYSCQTPLWFFSSQPSQWNASVIEDLGPLLKGLPMSDLERLSGASLKSALKSLKDDDTISPAKKRALLKKVSKGAQTRTSQKSVTGTTKSP